MKLPLDLANSISEVEMRVSKLAEALDLVDVSESITITWKGEVAHSEKWRKLILRKYFDEFGDYIKEFNFKTGGKIFWVLAFEKVALAGQTVSPGVGNVTHFSTSPVEGKSGRWTLNHDNSISSSSGSTLYPIQKSVKSIRQLVNMMKETAPTSTATVTPEAAKGVLEEGDALMMKMIKEELPKILPPYSSVTYNDKLNMMVVKDAMGRHRFGALFKTIGKDVYNVVVQRSEQQRGDNIDHVDNPAAVILSRVQDMMKDGSVRSEFVKAIMAIAFKDESDVKAEPSKKGSSVSIKLRDGDYSLVELVYVSGYLSVRQTKGVNDVAKVPLSINELDSPTILKLYEEMVRESPVGVNLVKRWDDVDDEVDFEFIKGSVYEVSSRGKVVGKMVISSNIANFYDKSNTYVDESPIASHSCLGIVEKLRGEVNESRAKRLERLTDIV